MKPRGCCKKCKLFKNSICKDSHEPTKGFNSTVYQCNYKKVYAKDKKKQDKKRVDKLIKELDIVFGNYIRYRDEGKCITCPSEFYPSERQYLHPGHYISRRFKNTRFDEENVYAQCRNCNGKQNYEGNGMMLEKIITKGKLTIEQVEALRERSKEPKKFIAHELEELIAIYTNKLDKLKEVN